MDSWDDLGRYAPGALIRTRPGFVLRRATREGRRCALLTPGIAADPARAAGAITRLVAAHREATHDHLAPVLGWSAGASPFAAFDGDFVADGQEVVRRIAGASAQIPYAAADGFIAGLRAALQEVHRTRCPTSGAPRAIGRIAAANVLFRADGWWQLLGAGHNVAVCDDAGAVDPGVPCFHAPELSGQGAPSPMGDYVALLLFMRSVLPYVSLDGTLGRIFAGDIRPDDAELIDALRWSERHVVGQIPSLRPSMDEAVRAADRVRALLGVSPDPAGYARFVSSLLRPQVPSLTVGHDGAWVRGDDGATHPLGRGARGIARALVAQRLRAPGATLSLWELVEAGWPGERLLPDAGANRAHVALNRLRRCGFRDVLERVGEGYRLSPDAIVRSEDDPSDPG